AEGDERDRLRRLDHGRAVPLHRQPRRRRLPRPPVRHPAPGRAMNSLRPYARLVRLPNLPSALADICLAALAVRALPGHWAAFGLVLLSSACLYSAGMALNDVFDLEQDRRERPDRPLPSGH